MVARIAPEPVSTSVAVSDLRSRITTSDASTTTSSVQDSPLPPVPTPVPTPVLAPIEPSVEAFNASLIVQQLPTPAVSLAEVRLRTTSSTWQAPASSLSLTDRTA